MTELKLNDGTVVGFYPAPEHPMVVCAGPGLRCHVEVDWVPEDALDQHSRACELAALLRSTPRLREVAEMLIPHLETAPVDRVVSDVEMAARLRGALRSGNL